jgi:hypothetical protein
MTIIACSRVERAMLSDSLLSGKDTRLGSVTKILRCKDGALAGAAGDSQACWMFLKWAEAGRTGAFPEIPKDEDLEGLVLTPEGEILIYWGQHPEPLLDDATCIGAGAREGMAAIRAGASLDRAVEIACELSTACAPPIQRLELEQTETKPVRSRRRR